jgi:hypothetical protein
MRLRIGWVVAVLAATMASSVPARAMVYDFTFKGGAADKSVSGSGTFTTDATNAVISGTGTFSIDGVSGATKLYPATPYTAGFNSDNVFPIDATAGLLFEGTTNSNFFVNIFAPTGKILGVGTSDAWLSATNGSGYLLASLGFAGVCTSCVADGSLSITAATPLPASWTMMFFGLGLLGYLAFRQKRNGTLLAQA